MHTFYFLAGGGFVLRQRPINPIRTWPPTGPGAAPAPAEKVTVTVHNTRAEWVAVRATAHAVIVQLPRNNQLPRDNRVEPGTKSKLTLTKPRASTAIVPAAAPRFAAGLVPADPTIGFVLPD